MTSASNVNERGGVRGTFSVGRALVLCVSGGPAAKPGSGVAPWWAGQAQTPVSLLCPRDAAEACGF